MIAGLREMLPLVESGWRHVPVLVVGDVMLDQYVWGDVERISPEAPVPVVRATLRDEKPGGAANVAMNLAGLGASVMLVGFAGGDREQQRLESLLADEGIEPSLLTVPNTPTTTKLRILSGHQQMMRLDTEPGAGPAPADYCRLLEASFAALPAASVLVLSDYAKGVLTETVCQALIREARRHSIPVLVDPKCPSFARYCGATAICPNRKELASATGESANDLDRLLSAGQELLPSLDADFIAVTLGEQGIAVLREGSRLHAPAAVREVYDVSGAGDTVIAVLALAMACGVSIDAAIQLANIAAGVVVSKVGTVPIQREELLGALSQEISLHMQEKVVPVNRLISRVTAWRSAGQRIVFTNGCFDILHIGHIRLLEEARRKGDRLIVGLNSDDSVRRLKGPLRPIVGELERGQVLAALSAVDAVVVFSEDTPLRLIEAIRPDVLVKGGDYTEDAVVGAREVRAWGGRVELIPLTGGVSTTRLIAKSVASVPAKSASRAFSA
jgi:D-beta-D-heptose 7-phosphate kinase / D-beta-D-heptose 1-phosphate adenosyltransferase